MRPFVIKISAACMLMLTVYGCGKNDPAPQPDPPGKAVLTYPERDAACTTGTTVSATQSSVTFTWAASAHTDSYEVGLKNLLSGAVSKFPSTTNQLLVTLDKNTPYSWYVVSKSAALSETATSEVWKFYNAGPGKTSYAPFPAEALSPVFGQSVSGTSVALKWTGSDVDEDIVGYDVYLGTNTSPVLLKANVVEMSINNVEIAAGSTYYWKVVTKDALGNTSDSDLFQFKVN